MKKCLFFLLIISINLVSFAQYKKASFLNKKGRTYDLGTSAHFLGGGNSTSLGFCFSYGKETSEKRLFHWFDLELLLKSKLSYSTLGNTSNSSSTLLPIEVKSDGATSLTYRYNLAYYLLSNNDDNDKKVLPFINLSLGYTFGLGGAKFSTSIDPAYNLQKVLEPITGALSAGGGARVVYKLIGIGV